MSIFAIRKKQKKILEQKKDKTITREEYRHLEWDRRFSNRRKRGVDRFWAAEKRRIENKEPETRNWTKKQRKDIQKGKVPKYKNVPIEGHRKYNAIDYPQLADDANNIYPATNNEHFNRWHDGNYQNETQGSLFNDGFKEEF